MPFRIVLEKENFKFSCSHFTILGPLHAERLHGHNYYLRLDILASEIDQALGMVFDFNLVKPLVRDIVAGLDEMILLPGSSPYLKITKSESSVGATLGSKKYLFPIEDVCILPIANVTSEELARMIAMELSPRIAQAVVLQSKLNRISVTVEETRGQAVAFEMDLLT
jgi:6-pyruvoyltetrahydropterin/6-carboxytetrahydropterin synthase